MPVFRLAAAAVLAAGLSAAAVAETPPPGPRDEAGPGLRGIRAEGPHGEGRMRDGADRVPHRALELLRVADLDGDGGVTRAELRTVKEEMFTWLDRNADGTLDLADRSPVEQRLAALPPPEGAADRPARRRGGDRAITREAFLAEETPMFDRIDADADGAVTDIEVEAFVGRIAMMSRWARGR